MLCLISESHSMHAAPPVNTAAPLNASSPEYEHDAASIVAALQDLHPEELSTLLKISPTLAAKVAKLLYSFFNHDTGSEAIEAFSGVVYKALSPGTLSHESLMEAYKNVRIVSCLFGLLRPSDIIKPYRLDFKMPSPFSSGSLASFWKAKTTIAIVKSIRDHGHAEILNLLPADASSQIGWNVIKRYAQVGVVRFQVILPGGKLKTPNAGKLKTLRGLMLRDILTSGCKTFTELTLLSNSNYTYAGEEPFPGYYTFVCND